MSPIISSLVGSLCISALQSPVGARPWMDAALSPDKRTELLLAAMTLEEKVAQLGYGGCGSPNSTVQRNPYARRHRCYHSCTTRPRALVPLLRSWQRLSERDHWQRQPTVRPTR
eukprot:SAG11_NODE_4192_length_2021_cov_3.484912_2_plen_114_part_00